MNESNDFQKNVGKEINLDNLYSALIECFAVIICGYTAGRLNLISQRETRGLDVFVRTFSLPSVIFLSLAQLDMSSVNWNFLGSILISKSLVFVGVILVTLCLNRPVHLGKLGLYAVFCTQSNDFALGYPILNALYGKEHPSYPSYVYLLAPISLAVLNPIAYVLLELGKHNNDESNSIDNNENFSVPKSEILESTSTNDIEKNSTIRNDSRHEEDEAKKCKSCPRKCNLKLLGKILLNIVTNPVMLMTVLGLIGNLFYQHIKFIDTILSPFATVFSTSALFVLGLKMVGTVQKLKGNAFVTPGILIITKLLVLPLVTREVVSTLHTGIDTNDTLNLSTFGFMYGTFPTAPMVFVLATYYDLEIESISSSLIICTFLSAPLMYISAKMIFMDFTPSDNYIQMLESFAFNLGIIGLPLCLWLIVVFVSNKAFNRLPHKITAFLFISQILICIGVALQPISEMYKPWSVYIYFSIFAFGIYSSRLWTCFLAVTLVVLQTRSLCFVIKLVPGFIFLAWGVPVIFVIGLCFAVYPDYNFGSLMNPDYRHGKFQSVVTLVLLLISFLGTCVCLILQHRYRKRFAKYLVLVQEVNSKDLQEVEETNIGISSNSDSSPTCNASCPKAVDIEEIGQASPGICSGSCKSKNLCSSEFGCTDVEREICEQTIKQYKSEAINDNNDEDHEDRQITRHIVLLLLLVTSMFVNLMLSIWTLVVEDSISGIYVEILFLNVILNVGQVFLTLAVFGSDSRNLFTSLTNRWRKFYYGAETIVLTPVEELGFETTHVCHQFIAHHLRECENEIARHKRLRLRLYKDCFKGKTMVTWLQTKRLARDETEAIQYASHLLEGRVLRHIENRHRFENSDLLYTFKQ